MIVNSCNHIVSSYINNNILSMNYTREQMEQISKDDLLEANSLSRLITDMTTHFSQFNILDIKEEQLKGISEEEILEYCADEREEFEAMTGIKYEDIGRDMELKTDAYYDRLKDYMEYSFTMGWNIKPKALKDSTYSLFDYFGIEMPEGVDKVEEKEFLKYEGLTFYEKINKAKYCQNYVIKGDNYFYNYYKGKMDSGMTHCLSIGSSSFYPSEENMDFKYEIYMKYLDKHFNVLESKPLLFDTHNDSASHEVIVGAWERNILHKNQNSINFIWKSFKNYRAPISPLYFEQRAIQASQIENNMLSYTILTFAQFQQIYGFLGAYKIESGKSWVSSNRHKDNVIHSCWMFCKFNKKCDKKVYYLVDSYHGVVFMKFHGAHHVSCERKNKENCYPAFRNLYVSCAIDNPNTCTDHLKINYRECYLSVVALGQSPSPKTLHNWRSKTFQVLEPSAYNSVSLSDYNYCAGQMKKALDINEMITIQHKRYVDVPIDENYILHHFIYNDQKDSNNNITTDLPGLIFSMKPTLKRLISSKAISCDATFNLIKDSSVKFITISYRVDTLDGKEPRNFLGCIGTLPSTESSKNFQTFFKELLNVCKSVFGDDVSIKWKNILTDDSQAELTGITQVVGNIATVRNCTWHKSLTFEKNLDVDGVTECMKAMYCLEEKECVSRLLLCMVQYDGIMKQLEKNPNQGLDWRYYVRKKKKSLTDIKTRHYNNKEALAFLRTKMFYLYRLFQTRERWALFARINASKFSATIMERLVNYNRKQNYQVDLDLDVMKQTIKDFRNKLVSRYNMDSELRQFEHSIKKDIPTIYKDDSIITSEKEIENAAITISSFCTTQASESIHSSLKNGPLKIHHLANMVVFSTRIFKYFENHEVRASEAARKMRTLPIMSNMGYLKTLSPYCKMVFNKEMRCVLSDNYECYHRKKYFSGIVDLKESPACLYCIKCRVLDIPCSHVLGNILFNMINKYKTDKKTLLPVFIRELDFLLLEKKTSRTNKRIRISDLIEEEDDEFGGNNSVEDGDSVNNNDVGETMDLEGLAVARLTESFSWIIDQKETVVNTHTIRCVEKMIEVKHSMSEFSCDPFPVDLEGLRDLMIAAQDVGGDYLEDARNFGEGIPLTLNSELLATLANDN